MLAPDEQWFNQSRYDYDTAQAMLTGGRYLYVLFCCQQSVEKTLKGLFVRKTGEFPPRLHSLLRLAEAAGLTLEGPRADLLGELSAYYVQSRYPEGIAAMGQQVTLEIAHDTLRKTEELLEWLRSAIR